MNSINLLNKTLLENKRVIVRGDLDVPVVLGKALETFRLDAMKETLDYLTIRNAKVILIGHLGRPEGKINETLRLNPIASYFISQGYKVVKLDEILNPSVSEFIKTMQPGTILMLENLRFDPREEANDEDFAKELASYGDYYVNECFSTSHRRHASFVGIPQHLRSFAGLRLVREVENLAKVLETPEKPVVAIFGGVKLETKLPAVSRFLSIADFVLLGGRLGLSYEGDNNYKVLVPTDYIGSSEDIGPKTVNMFANVISTAKTIVWNGPMGKFEQDEFMEGTRGVCKAVVASKAFSLVGGGDTITALDKLKMLSKMSFVSTGGGAMIEFISGSVLPGLQALTYYGKGNIKG